MVWSGGSGGQSLHPPAIPYIIVIDENSLECLTQMGKIDKSVCGVRTEYHYTFTIFFVHVCEIYNFNFT